MGEPLARCGHRRLQCGYYDLRTEGFIRLVLISLPLQLRLESAPRMVLSTFGTAWVCESTSSTVKDFDKNFLSELIYALSVKYTLVFQRLSIRKRMFNISLMIYILITC